MILQFMTSDVGFAVGIISVLILGFCAFRDVSARERLRKMDKPRPPMFRQLRDAGQKDGGRRK